MRKITFFTLLFLCLHTYAQESLKRCYKAPINKILAKSDSIITLQKKKQYSFNDLSSERQKHIIKEQAKYKAKLLKKYGKGDTIGYTYNDRIDNKNVVLYKSEVVDSAFINRELLRFRTKKMDSVIQVDPIKKKKRKIWYRKSFVLFEKDTIFVNPFLVWSKKDKEYKDRKSIYFYKLPNRSSIRLSFTEFTISGITIPLKYRFKGSNGLQEEFSTSFNANLFFGYSWGKTLFFHRNKVGNKTNTWKFTGGVFVGANTVELNRSNTSLAGENQLAEGATLTKGLGSLGLGINYSFNKINFGVFLGWDYAVGESAEIWNYNKEPWLGIGLGYDIIKLHKQ